MPSTGSRLTLLESARPTMRHAVSTEAIGLSVYAMLLMAAFVSVRLRDRMAPPREAHESVRFLAPRRQRAAVIPAQEAIQFTGLANRRVWSRPVISPSATGTTPLPPEQPNEMAGELLNSAGAVQEAEKAYSEVEVDSTVALDPTAEGPQYPPSLLEAGVEGVVYARFVVDSLGRVDLASFMVLDSPPVEFVAAVRTALAHMSYRPAKLAGRAVSQLVEQPFVFRIRNVAGEG
jgi:hypothetical protein